MVNRLRTGTSKVLIPGGARELSPEHAVTLCIFKKPTKCSFNYSKIDFATHFISCSNSYVFWYQGFSQELSFLGPSIISGTLHTHLCHKFESVKILKFKLNIHIAAITIPNSDKPSPLHIHRRISMGCAYKRP